MCNFNLVASLPRIFTTIMIYLHTFLNSEGDYSNYSNIFTFKLHFFFIHDLPGCNSHKTEVASTPSHVSRETRARPIVHKFKHNLHVHWLRLQPTVSRQNQPLLNVSLNLFRAIGNPRLSPLCSMWETTREVPSVLKAEALII